MSTADDLAENESFNARVAKKSVSNISSIQNNGIEDSNHLPTNRHVILKECGYGIAVGTGMGLLCGLLGGAMAENDPLAAPFSTISGFIIGYPIGNAMGVHLGATKYNNHGYLPITIISEVLAMGVTLITIGQVAGSIDSKAMYVPVGITLTFCLPTVAGVYSNSVTRKIKFKQFNR